MSPLLQHFTIICQFFCLVIASSDLCELVISEVYGLRVNTLYKCILYIQMYYVAARSRALTLIAAERRKEMPTLILFGIEYKVG